MNLLFWYLNTLSNFYYNYAWYDPINLSETSKVGLYLINVIFLLLGLSFHNWYISNVEVKYQDRLRSTQSRQLYVNYLKSLESWVELAGKVINYLTYAKILMIGAYFYPSYNLILQTFFTLREIGLRRFLSISWFYQSSWLFGVVTLINQVFKDNDYYYLFWIGVELCVVAYSKLTNQQILTGTLFSSLFFRFFVLIDKSKKVIPNSVYSLGVTLEVVVNCVLAYLYSGCIHSVKLLELSEGTSAMVNFLQKLETKIKGMTAEAQLASIAFNLCRVHWWVKLVQAKNKNSEYELREAFNKESKDIRHNFLFLHQFSRDGRALLKLIENYRQTLTISILKVIVYAITSFWVKLSLQGNLLAREMIWKGLDLTWLVLTLFEYIYKIVVMYVPL